MRLFTIFGYRSCCCHQIGSEHDTTSLSLKMVPASRWYEHISKLPSLETENTRISSNTSPVVLHSQTKQNSYLIDSQQSSRAVKVVLVNSRMICQLTVAITAVVVKALTVPKLPKVFGNTDFSRYWASLHLHPFISRGFSEKCLYHSQTTSIRDLPSLIKTSGQSPDRTTKFLFASPALQWCAVPTLLRFWYYQCLCAQRCILFKPWIPARKSHWGKFYNITPISIQYLHGKPLALESTMVVHGMIRSIPSAKMMATIFLECTAAVDTLLDFECMWLTYNCTIDGTWMVYS